MPFQPSSYHHGKLVSNTWEPECFVVFIQCVIKHEAVHKGEWKRWFCRKKGTIAVIQIRSGRFIEKLIIWNKLLCKYASFVWRTGKCRSDVIVLWRLRRNNNVREPIPNTSLSSDHRELSTGMHCNKTRTVFGLSPLIGAIKLYNKIIASTMHMDSTNSPQLWFHTGTLIDPARLLVGGRKRRTVCFLL